MINSDEAKKELKHFLYSLVFSPDWPSQKKQNSCRLFLTDQSCLATEKYFIPHTSRLSRDLQTLAPHHATEGDPG